jgi:hypothetical protein
MLLVSAAKMSNEKTSRALETDEKLILDRQLHGIQDGNEKGKLGPWAYATRWDTVVLVLSSISAIAAGAANPLLVVSPPPKYLLRERD